MDYSIEELEGIRKKSEKHRFGSRKVWELCIDLVKAKRELNDKELPPVEERELKREIEKKEDELEYHIELLPWLEE